MLSSGARLSVLKLFPSFPTVPHAWLSCYTRTLITAENSREFRARDRTKFGRSAKEMFIG